MTGPSPSHKGSRLNVRLLLIGTLMVAASLVVLSYRSEKHRPGDYGSSSTESAISYVDEQLCAQCHEQQH